MTLEGDSSLRRWIQKALRKMETLTFLTIIKNLLIKVWAPWGP